MHLRLARLDRTGVASKSIKHCLISQIGPKGRKFCAIVPTVLPPTPAFVPRDVRLALLGPILESDRCV